MNIMIKKLRLPLMVSVIPFCLSACNIEVSTSEGGEVVSLEADIHCRKEGGRCILNDYHELSEEN